MANELPKRKPLRLPYFDYNTPGAYFITICTHNRKNMFSRIVGAIHESPVIELTEQGKIVDKIINHLPSHLGVQIERYVIMPNHIHLIIMISCTEVFRAIHESPLRSRSVISKTVGYIKMNASKEIHLQYEHTNIWQRGFHDHVIRDQNDYEMIVKYIHENPLRWQYDCFYTEGE